MKITNRILEKLSAYLDGELTPEEKFETEEMLKSSPELREELNKIKKLKETVGGFKKLPEDLSFETRLMQNIKTGKKYFSKYNIPKPAVVFAAATIIMMVMLKSNSGFFEDWFSQGRSGIEAFYSKNLTSLLMAADLTNEDLFDFAFNKNLPLDATGKKVLSIGTDANGKEFLEVKYASVPGDGLKLNDFVKQFNLNKEQKGKVDSILESYSDRLASVVLVNDKNTIAVNPDLWKYHNDMRQDLISYASTVNKPAVISALGGEAAFADFIREPEPEAPVSAGSRENYYFITPDSIFYSWAKVDQEKIRSDIAKVRSLARGNSAAEKSIKIDLSPVFSVSGESENHRSMRIMVSDNAIKVEIPENISPLESDRDLVSMTMRLDSVFKQLQKQNFNFNVEAPQAPGNELRMTVKSDSRGRTSLNYGYDAPDVIVMKKDVQKKSKGADSISALNRKLRKYQFADSLILPDMKLFADSLSKKFETDFPEFFGPTDIDEFLNKNYSDSSGVNKNQLREEIRREMLQFRKEMNRLREEMKRFREELNPDKKKKLNEPIEI